MEFFLAQGFIFSNDFLIENNEKNNPKKERKIFEDKMNEMNVNLNNLRLSPEKNSKSSLIGKLSDRKIIEITSKIEKESIRLANLVLRGNFYFL